MSLLKMSTLSLQRMLNVTLGQET
ncbi:unnamed protein product [Acanthoscelides obtectus]|uniref:Uncharacterized protein n=1 Tax=Acanthoscelides obtectus TaxID=200917 RepID=A0A9P0QAI9_ACAOB|nr:unnamed protein product [Acanthoscelides obtectus]CAK1625336.1 hypothetical protein AOBTE_LOCUS3112 [Acanthoscelides obtectus]